MCSNKLNEFGKNEPVLELTINFYIIYIYPSLQKIKVTQKAKATNVDNFNDV